MKQHEWEKIPGSSYWLKVCAHCKTRMIKRVGQGFMYKINGDINNISFFEPDCVERPDSNLLTIRQMSNGEDIN